VLGGTALIANGMGTMLAAALPVLAYEEFDASSRVAGAFFAAFGIGAVVGSIVAVKLVGRFEPLRLGATPSSSSRCLSSPSRSSSRSSA
jgi:hypothetical protein